MHRIVCTVACLLALSVAAAVPEDAPMPPASPDGDLIPVKRVEPRFPRTALVNGISGRVKVEGTVGPDGSVIEVRVIDSNPPGVFDQSALTAVKQWKFKPRIVDGVAVARPFMQTITYSLSFDDRSDRLVEYAGAHRDQALALFARMRALCPDRYPHSDDAANAALQMKLTNDNLRLSMKTVEPEQQAFADALLIRGVEPCLFTSWEQLRDPEAYELSAWFAGFGAETAVAIDSVASLRAFADQKRTPPGAGQPTAEQMLQVRSWLFKRWVPAYYELINAQAKQFPPATPTGKATVDALARAKAATDRNQPKEARSILVKALKKTTDPIDRGLLLLALARSQVALREVDEAMASLAEAVAIEHLPWNLQLTAEMARATLCGRTGNGECFEASRARLHAELGVTDKFKF